MASTFSCAKADEVDLVGHLSPVIRVGDEEYTVAELVDWPHLKGSRVEYPTGSSRFWEFSQFDYGLTLPLSNLAKSVMNMIGACPAQLNCNFWEVILVCETLNERWVASGSERRITAKDFLEYYDVKYVTVTDGAYLSSSSSRPCLFGMSAGRVFEEGIFYRHRCREGTELKTVLKELEISRFKRVASKDDKVKRSQAKRRMAGKTLGSMEEKLSTPELNTALKLARLNKMPDRLVDMATASSTVVRNLAKRKAVKRGAASRSGTSDNVGDNSKRRKVTSPTKSQVVLEESDKIAEGADLRPRFEVEAGLLEEQCRAKARKKMVAVVDDEFLKFARVLRGVQLGFQDRPIELEKKISQREGEKNQFKKNLTREREAFQLKLEKEREAAALKPKEVRAKSVAEAKRLVTASATSRDNLARKLYQLRYTKAEIMAFSKGNYEEKEIMDEEEVEEMEDGLNVAEKTSADNQETIYQKELDVARKREEQTLLYNAEYAEEYEALISQDLASNQLTSELVELKEKAASGSRHEAELAEYRIRALNKEISDMKCNLHTMNEQLLKREIDLDTARTNLAASEADVEKLSSSMLDRLKADLHRLNGREAQSRADLAEVQAKNKSLVDKLAHARRNVRRVVQRDKEMNERINQLCARISESERVLRVREMKYQKDLKFELDKRDGEIASCEGSREMKEFLHRKEELVENMRIDLTNSR
ncbi:hypothetical protein GIB67_007435 [Kingdonia uniflora]|uniref:Uncharacterized protein n=1 Tax=Kingdonia uniflora TaxID=39325 RepID=A0A7J7MM33_9MAGN|nr:hypothetical protein GIB67_007435 [Kingdonia uniflora]